MSPSLSGLSESQPSRRALIAGLLAFTACGGSRVVSAQNDPWAILRRPGSFALIRHATAPGTNDPPGFRLEDCATQRNLSAEGRVQSVRIGDLFRANSIAEAGVYSSQWCRCLDTAHLTKLGEVRPQPLLNSFFQDRSREAGQIEALRRWIAELDLAKPTVFVTHQVVVTAISQIFPGSGEIVVMQRTPGSQLTVQGRLPTA
ncbi:MAG: phosphohistidine phosphatase SixA [Rhodospirillaceae bacterium]|nr:MAG: phosphohistidine phosphatase SixA [Rhodospirillaceae bacterium]